MKKIVRLKYKYRYIFFAAFVAMCIASCDSTRDSNEFKFEGFLLREGGYLAKSNTILIEAMHSNIPEEFGFNRMGDLLVFDLSKHNVEQTISRQPGFLDFSWIPAQESFITDSFNRIDLYSMDNTTKKYYGSAIECPIYM